MKVLSQEIYTIFSLGSLLFSYLDDESYRVLTEDETWNCVAQKACDCFGAPSYHEECLSLTTPPDKQVHALTQNSLFIAGMPLAAMPVESLYTAWSKTSPTEFGSSRGLYGGDSASHLSALYQDLGFEIPPELRAMPDHLSLIFELIVSFFEVGNNEAANQIVHDHLAWLGEYQKVLEKRAKEVYQIEAFSEEKKRDVQEGIVFYRAFIVLVRHLLADEGIFLT